MFEALAHILGEVVLGLTGHLILWMFTLGRWDINNGREEAAAVVGILFWVAVAASLWFAFFR